MGRIKDKLKNLILPAGATPLPVAFCLVIFGTLLCTFMTFSMVFSYLPKMMKSFGVSEVNVGRDSGFIASAFFVARVLTCYPWGVAADRFGKKRVLLISMACLCTSTLVFGFSNSVYWAAAARFLQGASSGITVAAKGLLYGICDATNQPFAVNLLSTCFEIGIMIAPSFAGLLVFPADQWPQLIPQDSLLATFPSLLPNLVITVLLLVCVVGIVLIIPSDRPVAKSEPEVCSNSGTQYGATCSKFKLGSKGSVVTRLSSKSKTSNTFFQTLKNRDCLISCLLYTAHGMVIVGFEDIYPVYAATIKIFNGLEFSPKQIGILYSIVAPILLPLQIVLIPKIAKHLSAKQMVVLSSLLLVFAMPLIPCPERIRNINMSWTTILILMILIRFWFTAKFTGISIFINNSVHHAQLSSANGLGMAMSACGRAAAPLLFGNMYSWSMTNIKHFYLNSLGFPFNQYLTFYFIGLICLLMAIGTAYFPERLNRPRENGESDMDRQEEV